MSVPFLSSVGIVDLGGDAEETPVGLARLRAGDDQFQPAAALDAGRHGGLMVGGLRIRRRRRFWAQAGGSHRSRCTPARTANDYTE